MDDRQKSGTPSTKDRNQTVDDFWNVESLVPSQKQYRPIIRRTSATPTAVDVELNNRPTADPSSVGAVPLTVRKDDYPAPSHTAVSDDGAISPNPYGTSAAPRGDRPLTVDSGKPHYVPPHTPEDETAEQPMFSYVPDGVLLHQVSVYEWKSNYHYFDEFATDAVAYAAKKPTEKAPVFVPFFSYFPQYVQFNKRQAAWYLYWRECVRRGQNPETDYSYLLLYMFELINLPVTQEEAVRNRNQMADVWMAYRKSFAQLDRYMCEWLCDYCLIHKLNAPVDRLSDALSDIIEISRLKEFYLTAAVTGESHDMESARILLRHCCQYDYHKSKFAQGENAALFDTVIPQSVAAVLPILLGRNNHPPLITMQDTVVTRDAYVGALCAYRNKRRIYVSCTSFSRSHEFRFLIGDIVKHVENRIRAWLGVRSRLSVMSLPNSVRDAVDAYLVTVTPSKTPSKTPSVPKTQPRPEYEKLYDLPRKKITVADADAIEQSSWDTTRILTEAFADDDTNAPIANESPTELSAAVIPATEEPSEPVAEESFAAPKVRTAALPADPLTAALLTVRELIPFVRLALTEDGAGQRAFSVNRHAMPDAIADTINNATAESEFGDVILEDRGDGVYTVPDDYRIEVSASLADAE